MFYECAFITLSVCPKCLKSQKVAAAAGYRLDHHLIKSSCWRYQQEFHLGLINTSICCIRIKSNVPQLVLLVLQIHLHQALQLRVIRQVCLAGVADICIKTKKPQLVINEYNNVVLNVGSDWIVMYGSLGGV